MLQRAIRMAFVVLVSLTLGAIAAATTSFIGWRLVSPAPTAEEATAAVRIGLPNASIASIGWHDDVRDIHSVERPSAKNVPGQQQVQLGEGATSREGFDEARERFAGAGWRTKVDSDVVPGGGYFLAHRGNLVMEWEFSPSGRYAEPSGDSVEVWVWRFTPVSVKIFTLAGWLLGAAPGWWLARAALRPGRRGPVIGLAVVAGVLALSTLAAVVLTAQNLLDIPMRSGQPVAIWVAYLPFLAPFGFQFG